MAAPRQVRCLCTGTPIVQAATPTTPADNCRDHIMAKVLVSDALGQLDAVGLQSAAAVRSDQGRPKFADSAVRLKRLDSSHSCLSSSTFRGSSFNFFAIVP